MTDKERPKDPDGYPPDDEPRDWPEKPWKEPREPGDDPPDKEGWGPGKPDPKLD